MSTYRVWGTTAFSLPAAQALGAKGHETQIRVVVQAKSRAAAARYFVAAGLFHSTRAADHQIKMFGSETWNAQEIATCSMEGRAHVSLLNDSKRYLSWPPLRVVEVVLLDAAGEPIPGMRVPYDPGKPVRFPPTRIEAVVYPAAVDDKGHLHQIGVRPKAVAIGDTYTVTGLLP